MFNIQDKKGKMVDNPFKELVSLIDPSIETFRFPNFTTNHIGEKYFHYNRGTLGCCENEHIFNRKTFLTMLIIALSEKEPTIIEFEKIKMEMGRLAFVGDSAIIQSQVMTFLMDQDNTEFSEKNLDNWKNKAVKNIKLKERAHMTGLQNFIIKSKYYQKTPPNPAIESMQSTR